MILVKTFFVNPKICLNPILIVLQFLELGVRNKRKYEKYITCILI